MIFETPTVAGQAAGNVVYPKRIEQTPVSYLFFHPENVNALHTSIRFRVYKKSGKVIDRQGQNQMHTIMSAVYENSQDPTLESAIDARSAAHIVRVLNDRVLQRAVREILTAIQMHTFYLQDISTPVPTPLDRPQFADQRKGKNPLELPVGL